MGTSKKPDASHPPAEDQDENTIEASFAVLELCLEQLAAVAPVSTPEMILDLIPEVSTAGQRLVVVELIKFDMAVAAESGECRPLEFYWPACGAILPQEDIPFDLVLEEVQLLKAAGESPRWADYRQRFPDLADTIGKWLAGGETQILSGSTNRVPELPIGEQFDDFEVIKQLGQGAFARVYLARQVSMHRLVALKATSRGSEEPQALSQLDHANIVRVYDQRGVEDPPTILLYMQYLPGGTLADCIKHVRDLPPEHWTGEKLLVSIDQCLLEARQTVPEQSLIRDNIHRMEWAEMAAWIGIQLADGLHYANEKGVLHRDVKPANILLSAEAIPKLADFNVSCVGLSGRAGAAAYFGGSLAYMSPEQLQVADPTDQKSAEELDGRSDLYALGIVLWELWQGRRPWTMNDIASNWTDAVILQRELRKSPFEPIRPAKTAAERVLEKVLRSLLSIAPHGRPTSGKETAARLRLAFYPELAKRFEPSAKSFTGRLLSLPVILLSALLIFGPNVAAAVFNYAYNLHRMELKAEEIRGVSAEADVSETVGESQTRATGVSWIVSVIAWIAQGSEDEHPVVKHFRWVSYIVNGIVFPLGGFLFWLIIWPFTKIVHRGIRQEHATERDIAYLWTIGYRATLVTAILWAVSGAVFSASMATKFPEHFGASDGIHFFLSLVLCGGVAWIYPYFGMTLLSMLVYYPKVVAPSMSDPSFDDRSRRVRRHSAWYLMSAAAIPLVAIGALVIGERDGNWVLAAVAMTAIGLAVAYFAHNKIDQAINEYGKVLGNRNDKLALQV